MDLDALDPLDPLKPTSAGSDQAAGRAVTVGGGPPADVCGDQEAARVAEAKAPAVAGTRDDAYVASARQDACLVEQAPERDAAPVLRREEAARAIQRGGERIAAVQLGGGDRQGPLHVSGDGEPVAARPRPRPVCNPPRGWG